MDSWLACIVEMEWGELQEALSMECNGCEMREVTVCGVGMAQVTNRRTTVCRNGFVCGASRIYAGTLHSRLKVRDGAGNWGGGVGRRGLRRVSRWWS